MWRLFSSPWCASTLIFWRESLKEMQYLCADHDGVEEEYERVVIK